jgi:hypothetical protein
MSCPNRSRLFAVLVSLTAAASAAEEKGRESANAAWVQQCIAKDRGVFSMEGATLCSFHFRELRRRNLLTPDDERWVRELLLALRQYHYAWRPGDRLWRGSHHLSATLFERGSHIALRAKERRDMETVP